MKKIIKKKMNKKKKKMIIITTAIVLVFVILIVLLKISQNKPINSKDEANSLQSIVEFCECKFISSKESKVQGYSLDIYLEFKYDTYQDGESKQPYYDVTIDGICEFLKFNSIRLIDESRDLIIRVDTNSTSITKKYFNDVEESEYFSKLLSQINQESEPTLKETDFNVVEELQTLVTSEWQTKNINFGQKTSTFRNYDIYFDNGYRIRTINEKVFNIVFTKKFTKEVIKDIKVGDSFEKIKQSLGDNYIEKNGILEYMGKDLYVCFSTNEISVYPRISYNYTQFEKLVERYNEDKDFNSFMNSLTSLWPDYSLYRYDTSYCEIWYPLKGVKIYNSRTSMEGIQLYLEYTGTFKNEHKNYYQLYYKTNDSVIIEQEKNRILLETDRADVTDGSYKSTKYVMKADFNTDNKAYNIAFFSIDKNNADSELNKSIYASKTYWYDDENLIYSVAHQGIYIYNATTRETRVIVTGTDNFDITNFDYANKILTYDGKDIKI